MGFKASWNFTNKNIRDVQRQLLLAAERRRSLESLKPADFMAGDFLMKKRKRTALLDDLKPLLLPTDDGRVDMKLNFKAAARLYSGYYQLSMQARSMRTMVNFIKRKARIRDLDLPAFCHSKVRLQFTCRLLCVGSAAAYCFSVAHCCVRVACLETFSFAALWGVWGYSELFGV